MDIKQIKADRDRLYDRLKLTEAKLYTIEKGVWRIGEPDSVSRSEWFIAKTKYGDKVVLKCLYDEHSYDYKTADDTYMLAGNIVAWMQFPDSHFLPPDDRSESVDPYIHISNLEAAVIAAEALADAMDAVTHMHGTNPSDACADMPEADYLKYFLGEVRSHAREALAAYREATS